MDNDDNKENPQTRPKSIRPTSGLSLASSSSQSNNNNNKHKLSKRFTVIRKLGKGTYGKVQLAINKQTGQEVAIKTIKKSKIENEEDMQRVRREIQIMRSIEHPHIIHIYEEFENKDKIVLIMQYAPGGELYEYVSQSNVLDDNEARRLFRQISTAIYYCHQNKICHRDLKLENILLDEKNNAKLADFGLSNVFDKRRQLKTFCGSPLYASPEIVQGSPYEGPEVDCWSLGVLLYTLVYGAMPFDGSNFKRLVKQISEASYYEPSEKSQASPLIRRLLCADPNKRATILDICSDPWVNGCEISGSPTASPMLSPKQQHHSLMEVARDMANLTPVRIDMLNALTESEIERHKQRQLAQKMSAKPPTAAVGIKDGQVPEKKKPPPPPPQQQQQQKPFNLDPESVMEVDDESHRATSPMASYVVRDLEPEETAAKEPLECPEKQRDEVAEIIVEQNPAILLEDTAGIETVEMAEPVTETKIEELPISVDDETTKLTLVSMEKSKEKEEEAEISVEQLVEKPLVESSEHEKGIQPSIEAQAMDDGPATSAQSVEMELDTEQPKIMAGISDDREPRGSLIKADGIEVSNDIREDKNEADELSAVKEAPVGSTNDIDETSPKKKVKKKIIVKKKKKVSKKEGQSDSNRMEDSKDKKDETQAINQQEKRKTSVGKIKIPNSFQPKEDQQPAQSKLETRRQSALVADVSQKLLQSVSGESKQSSAALSESEQQQLTNVRVLDKKEEFERRLSLATPSEQVTQRSQATSPITELQVEALQAQLIREMHESTSQDREFESVQVLQPLPVDSISKLETPETNERSDSLETIRAEPGFASSSLRIDLSPLQDVCPDLMQPPEQQQQQPQQPQQEKALLGPAPIARSYKKVTFTNDGACITETGKIYSTRNDDGTLRRVERKSKVTHYPSDDPSSKSHMRSEKIVYEDSKSIHRAPSGNLSRLIMPTGFESDGESDDADFIGLQQRRSSSLIKADNFNSRLNRSNSGSSCSSASTDILEDIFDTWTGAISMFDRHDRSSLFDDGLFRRAGSRLSSSSFGRRKRNQSSSNSQMGNIRCESVEPQSRANLKNPQSGYESDVGAGSGSRRSHRQRPSSAAGGMSAAKGFFGSFRMLNEIDNEISPRGEDDFFKRRGDSARDMFAAFSSRHEIDPFEMLEREQRNLRQRLAQQHRQLWKGSTPSLFDEFSPREQSTRSQRQATDPRLPTGNTHQRSTSQSNKQHQSSSNTCLTRQQVATPLDSAPTRRNTTNFSPLVGKSISKTSIATSSAVRQATGSGSDITKQNHHHSACFIELKRTSSSASSSNKVNKAQQQMTPDQVSGNESIASSFWNNRETPTIGSSQLTLDRGGKLASTKDDDSSVQREAAASPARESVDRRVQSWLQESSSNLSATSSGSKSSATDSSLHSSSRQTKSQPDPFESLYGSSWQQAPSYLPPHGRSLHSSDSSSRLKQHSSVVQLKQQQQSSSSILEQSKSSLSEQVKELAEQRIESLLVKDGSRSKMVSSNKQAAMITTAVRHIRSPDIGEESQPIASPIGSSSLQWIQSMESSSRLINDDNELEMITDSLDSRSSSSLLDQLKSKGYRSMINRRIISSTSSSTQNVSAQNVSDSMTSIGSGGGTKSSASKIVTMTVHEESIAAHSSSSGGSISKRIGQHEEDKKDEVPTKNNMDDNGETISNSIIIEPDVGSSSGQAIDDVSACSPDKEASERKKEEEEEEEEEEDEDILEAKANIKCHLDQIKETELFLKSMRLEEENMERRRQQMNIFNDLYSNINGFNLRSSCFQDSNSFNRTRTNVEHDTSFNGATSGMSSAPIRGFQHNGGIGLDHVDRNGFLSSAPINFEPNCTIPGPKFSYGSKLSEGEDKLILGQPATDTSPQRGSPTFRRSRSQLGDQFSALDFSINPTRRPLSGCLDQVATNETYYPSRAKRSLSQLRYTSTNRLSQPVAISEYRSAYGGSSSTSTSLRDLSPLASDNIISSGFNDGSDEEQDDGMSSYRVSAYVPKVNPVLSRGRSVEKRTSYTKTSETGEDNKQPRMRRISLQVPSGTKTIDSLDQQREEVITSTRRSSLKSDSVRAIDSSSRLSELEQRILNNKRRREDLLAGKFSPEPKSVPKNSPTSTTIETLNDSQQLRDSSPSTSTSSSARALTGIKVGHRSSRLESMEARIKRKSYCVRVGDCSPERTQLKNISLEKWRNQQNMSSASASGQQSPRNSITGIDSSQLLLLNGSSSLKQ